MGDHERLLPPAEGRAGGTQPGGDRTGGTALPARLAAQHSRDLIYRYRFLPEPGFDYVNGAVERFTGHAAEAVYADPRLAEALVHPEDRPILEAAWRTRGTHLPPAVRPFARGDGSVLWTELRRTPVFDAMGRLVAIEGIVLDVTARVRMEDSLREALRLFQATADALPNPLAVLRREGDLVAVNDAWRRDPLLPEAAGAGDDLLAACDAGAAGAVPEARALAEGLREVLGGRRQAFEVEFRRPGAEGDRWLLARVSAFPPEGPAHAVLLVEDVTWHRRAAERLAEIARLRDRERVREIEQLRTMARFRTELLNTAAHELNTPLTALKLQLAVLRGRLPPGDAQMERLDRNVDRLARLVRDVLDVGRLSAGRLPLVRQRADLVALAREAVETLDGAARQAGVALTLAPAPPVACDVDPHRVLQVLLNLADNAVKFTQRGGEVRVEVEARGGEGVVRVRDSGVGLTEAQRHRLFQPFTQVQGTTEELRGGFGLGLYISKGIAEAHGGRIEVHSQGAGRGTTFEVALPLAPAIARER